MKCRNRIFITLVIFAISGCIKTGTKEIIMPDQELKGNRGFLKGTPPKVEEPRTPRKKKILDIEVELPPLFEKTPPRYTEDKEIWGNAGYIYSGREEGMKYIYVPMKVRKLTPRTEKVEEESLPEEGIIPETGEETSEKGEVAVPQAQPKFIEYKVGKGESLWTIAKKVYGDPTKWTVIYENNRDILTDPEKLRPGMVLKIPLSEEVNTEYIK
ncbi:MAG: LysM peptidoglycan-binding domain-containing protein [Candidatus Omnitrophica bacterium]|nr:LysM peptidoglycan-binding domain-containing protein [Candidatus Omnitrophota bacterium]